MYEILRLLLIAIHLFCSYIYNSKCLFRDAVVKSKISQFQKLTGSSLHKSTISKFDR